MDFLKETPTKQASAHRDFIGGPNKSITQALPTCLLRWLNVFHKGTKSLTMRAEKKGRKKKKATFSPFRELMVL